MTRKTLANLLGALVATALILAACAAPAAAPTPATIKETVVVQQTVPVPVTATPAPVEAPIATINFWHTYNPVETKVLEEKVIPAFEQAHPNIKVQDQTVPYDDFRKKLLTAIAGGTAPDVARLDIAWLPEFADLGALAALDTLMNDFDTYKSAVFPGPLSTNAWKDHYYGLPLDTNTRAIVWNKDVYTKAGLIGAPKTIDDFLADCAKIKAAGSTCFADGGTYGWAVMPWIWSMGGDITDPKMTTSTGYINGPDTVAAYQLLKDMLDNGYLDKAILGGGLDTYGAFAKDQLANVLDGPWMPPLFASQYPDKAIDFALMPAGKGGPISVVGGEDIALFQQSQNQEAAAEFVRYMLSPETQLALAEAGQVPVRADVADQAVKAHPYFQIFFDQLKTARARLPHPNWPKIESILTDAGQVILRGEKTPQAALDEAAAKIDPLLK
ncbi:MAG: extracellular solute-binding protein [Chloroflexi bacterium]|nr:extracellular solute-binding protein [Chloroflexota bacterium]MBI5828966.1 extracellular solute-binding protein [Chloroflexota bacterium]